MSDKPTPPKIAAAIAAAAAAQGPPPHIEGLPDVALYHQLLPAVIAFLASHGYAVERMDLARNDTGDVISFSVPRIVAPPGKIWKPQ